MDASNAWEYVFPHLSAWSREGPSKAIGDFHTIPLKVQNGIVHGDQRSHVILSPGTVVSSASWIIETLIILINVAFLEHGDLPPIASVVFDNAPNNHNILVLAFCALYLLYGVFGEFKLRFLMPHHAHDIFDAMGSVHTNRVRRSTFFFLEELIALIKGAHKVKSPSSSAAPGSWGHDDMVSNLWTSRDIWEWMAPGCKDDKTAALSQAAFVYYDGLSQYHDFSLRLEASSTADNPRVGLWCKQWMSDADYKFLGTLITGEMVQKVMGDSRPQVASESVAEKKTGKEKAIQRKFDSVTTGKFKEQFSPERMRDAMAINARDWDSFKDSSGKMPEDGSRSMLPDELIAIMRHRGVRQKRVFQPNVNQIDEDAPLSQLAPAKKHLSIPRQMYRVDAGGMGITRGHGVKIAVRYGKQPKSKAEFKNRPVNVGCFVATRAIPSSTVGRANAHLAAMNVWIWRVAKAFAPGELLPTRLDGKMSSDVPVYLGHLHGPARKAAASLLGPLRPYYHESTEEYMMTEQEKRLKKSRSSPADGSRAIPRGGAPPAAAKGKRVMNFKRMRKHILKNNERKSRNNDAPATCLLRPANIIGGGFMLTGAFRVPKIVLEVLAD